MTGARLAIATPSYRGDIERCRLLCASIDHFISGLSTHYLLVEDRDVALFRDLNGPRRRVVAESELFPHWLKSWPDPFAAGRRRAWTGIGALRRGLMPLRGWHSQQLRKLALPGTVDDDIFLMADSDALFLRPYDLAEQLEGGAVRLFCRPAGITPDMTSHVGWLHHAASVLGLPAPALPADDHIDALATWTRADTIGLREHLEAVSGRHWISAIASRRAFSEMIVYGQFVEHLRRDASRHVRSTSSLCRTFWTASDVRGLDLSGHHPDLLGERQVAVTFQSFIGVPMDAAQAMFRRAADPAALRR